MSAFPLYRRSLLVAEIAETLRITNGEDANVFWRRTAKRLLDELQASGVARHQAEDEIRTLLKAVLRELCSRSRSAMP